MPHAKYKCASIQQCKGRRFRNSSAHKAVSIASVRVITYDVVSSYAKDLSIYRSGHVQNCVTAAVIKKTFWVTGVTARIVVANYVVTINTGGISVKSSGHA